MMLNRVLQAAIPACLFCASVAQAEQAKELQTVRARTLELKVPATWRQSKPTSRMRTAQFAIPAAGDSAQGAELVVFYFGGPTGGTKANIDRWISQFQPAGRKVQTRQGDCAAGSYILVDISGTWKKPDGPPFARKTIDTPNSRVINVMLAETKDGKKDYYFLKLSGPDALVKSAVDDLRVAIGADPDSEKPFSLENAEN